MFERILYNSLFNFLNQNEIYHAMDEGYEIRGAFLDISKAFDKVWHEYLIGKISMQVFPKVLSWDHCCS